MFGLGFTEILVILTVALLVFGPKRLPEIARTLGKTVAELRRTLDEIKFDINKADYNLTPDQDDHLPSEKRPAEEQAAEKQQPEIDDSQEQTSDTDSNSDPK